TSHTQTECEFGAASEREIQVRRSIVEQTSGTRMFVVRFLRHISRDLKGAIMEERIKSPVLILPDAMQALQMLAGASGKGGVPAKTIGLVQVRASQINGCSVCIDMHTKMLKKAGETDERLFAVAAWRDAPYFTDAERAALALTEAVTRLSDREDPVPDKI